MASDQEDHFIAKAVTHIHEAHWSYHVAHHPEAIVLMDWCNDPLKKQPIACWKDNTAQIYK